jgi:hypothetical protein
MNKAAMAGATTNDAIIRKIADEAFSALNNGGQHAPLFSTRYPAFQPD